MLSLLVASVDGRILALLICGLGFGVYLFIKGFILWRRKRFIENIPTSKVRSLAMGQVELYGKVVPSKDKNNKPLLLKTPFSDLDCVYYSYKIQELRSTGKHTYWATIAEGEEYQLFYLKDDTGEVLVNPKGAKFELTEHTYTSGSGFGALFKFEPSELPKPIKNFLASKNISYTNILGLRKTMRFTETYILPDSYVYILGIAGDNPFVPEGSVVEHYKDIMIGKGEGQGQFFISDKSEREILSSYSWKCPLYIFGGSLIIIICLWFLLVLVPLL